MIILLSLGLATIGCGSSNNSNSGNINGAWTANHTNTDNSPVFGFTTNFTQESGGSISVTNFKFTTTSPCFSGDTTETGELSVLVRLAVHAPLMLPEFELLLLPHPIVTNPSDRRRIIPSDLYTCPPLRKFQLILRTKMPRLLLGMKL